MPCGRQNVPPAAFITKRNLWRLKLWGKANFKGSLGVLVLSYPWLDWFHPDRLGAQLRRLLPFLKAMLAEAKRDSPHCTVGVMIDFLCLPQKPFATEEDGARFGVSLKAINAWYFHQFTYTLLVTTPPPEGADYSNTRLHRDRGWCFFEQAASMVVKDDNCLLDFGAYEGATEFGDYRAEPGTCIGQMKAGRKPPIAPDAFGERMRARVASGELTFTANADMGFVIGQYEAGFVAAINRVAADPGEVARRLFFMKLGWGDAEAAELRLALQYAAAKCAFPEGAVRVSVTLGNSISEEALATLPPPATAPELRIFWPARNVTLPVATPNASAAPAPDGAHAAELFRGLDGKHYLANCVIDDAKSMGYYSGTSYTNAMSIPSSCAHCKGNGDGCTHVGPNPHRLGSACRYPRWGECD